MPDEGARKRLGNAGERFAVGWLEARGYMVVARHWRCPYGELDVVAERDGELIFVEVKSRRGVALGAPEEAVTPAKRRLSGGGWCWRRRAIWPSRARNSGPGASTWWP